MSETRSASVKQTPQPHSSPTKQKVETVAPKSPSVQRLLAAPGVMRATHILGLQATAGNRAVARFLANKSTAQRIPKQDARLAPALKLDAAGNVAGIQAKDAGVAARLRDWIPARAQRVTAADVISPPALPGTSTHPTIRKWSPQPMAIKELQSRLNSAPLPGRRLVIDGIFGPKTHAKVVAFQTSKGIAPANGVVDAATWTKVDMLPAAKYGQVERQWEEKVGGETYGMTSKFTWEITPRQIRVTVKIDFQRPAQKNLVPANFNTKVQESIAAITARWNTFRAKKAGSTDKRDIEFVIARGAGNVAVKLLKGNKTSDAENWYVGDSRFPNMVAHEFGHLIGLQDEYRVEAADYLRTHPGGALPAAPAVPAGYDAKAVATQLSDFLWATGSPAGTATNANRGQKTLAFMQAKTIAMGKDGTGQLVRKAYETQVKAGNQLIADINARIGNVATAVDGATHLSRIMNPFMYSDVTSLMGSAYNQPGQATALILPQPRHLNEFVMYVQNYLGGQWIAERRT